jgi:transposase
MARHSVPQADEGAGPSQLQRRWQREFRQRWQAVAPEQWCCIGIDVGKYEHVAIAYDGREQLLAPPLRFGIRAADYETLFKWVANLMSAPEMTPLFGLEPTGHYYEQLAYDLSQQYTPQQVYIVQATDVARRRAD